MSGAIFYACEGNFSVQIETTSREEEGEEKEEVKKGEGGEMEEGISRQIYHSQRKRHSRSYTQVEVERRDIKYFWENFLKKTD